MAETTPAITFDADDMEALDGSIAKWESIVSGTGIDKSGANCPLCQLADKREDEWKPDDPEDNAPDYCLAFCVVGQATRKRECKGTPYWDFRRKAKEITGDRPWIYWARNTPRSALHAQAMLDYLKGLKARLTAGRE